MLNRQLPDLLQSCYRCMDVKGEKFAYALLKNKNKIKKKLEEIYSRYQVSEDFKIYDEQRIKLAEKHAKKDDKGEPIVNGEKYDIENKEEFEKELNELKEKHKDAIEEREKQIEDYEKELDEESDIEIHKIRKLPEGMSAREIESAEFMIK